ncbi:hypothetical protein HHE014_11140 [Helicobacter heilmannii]|uniref:Uncharacterized protein n=1 Tax=Helicobacter heilmannii TaxID=35817 RepID=A0A0K2YAJ8_HELHE|nr:hypothetical protein BN341_16510 [Helicobacter heilmannii ASB1.4]CRF46124.1 hypothetical protein HHE014_11140 [Helicobacter heilmannii]CRI35222.1 hypothetical protein HHE01_02200 [Helicobacter heilmannii]
MELSHFLGVKMLIPKDRHFKSSRAGLFGRCLQSRVPGLLLLFDLL